MTLIQNVRSYLAAENYSITERSRGLLVGTREAVGGHENIFVWVPSSQPIPERLMMAEFGAVEKLRPQARKFVLVETMEGIGTEFRSDALRYFGVQISTPARFFDTTFREEDARTTATITRRLRDRGREHERYRVRQPFVERRSEESGEDLLPLLIRQLRSRKGQKRPISLVIGPAGIGKTYLFESLFAELYDAFQADKRGLTPARRPLPLMPEYVAFASDVTFHAILDAFLSTEFTRPLNRKAFEWKLLHGYGTWLIDGLDEVIARDNRLFEDLLDLVTIPDVPSSPSVLICLRDSVFSTSAELRDFVSDLDEHINIYKLAPWGETERKQFAQRHLKTDADAFLSELAAKRSLDELARLPFYCSLLSDQFQAGKLKAATSDVELLEGALDGIIEREYAKELIDRRYIEKEELQDLLEGIAAENMARQFTGVDFETLVEWAELVIPEGMVPEDRERLLVNLTQLALFAGAEHGRLRFAQELLEHYLLGRYLVEVLGRSRSVFASRLGATQIPWDWLTMRVIVDFVRNEDRVGEITALAYENQHEPITVKNLLQIAALSSKKGQTFQSLGFPLEMLDLSGLRFESHDFSGVSLRGSNLTDTEFINCVLNDVALEGAILRNTRLSGGTEDKLAGADVGDLSTFYSLNLGAGETITDIEAARAWLADHTAKPVRSVSPCPSAQQLRHMLGKYVYPTGQARRSWLDANAIVRGTQYIGDVQILADALVRHGYIVMNHGRYERPGGDKYAHIVEFVRDLALSSGLRRVLNYVCERESCQHIPRQAPT